MLEALLLLAYAAGLIWIGVRAFARPRGVYWRSAAGVAVTALAAGLLWQLAAPSGEAGFGALVIWAALVALALLAGLVASAAATVRHMLDFFSARR